MHHYIAALCHASININLEKDKFEIDEGSSILINTASLQGQEA